LRKVFYINKLKSLLDRYDQLDRRAGMTLPNGISAAYSYDAAGRLTGMKCCILPPTTTDTNSFPRAFHTSTKTYIFNPLVPKYLLK
jgi:YD repeat-containing protein